MGIPLWSNIFRKDDTWQGQLAKLWAATPLFEDIPMTEIEKLAQNMFLRKHGTEEVIFRTNDQGAGAAMILSGTVEIRAGDVVLTTLGAGDFFGEVSLILDSPRTADAVAVAPSELAFFMRVDLEEWVERVPRHGARLANNLAHVLAQRLMQANALLARKGS